ncbi:MAG TPA: PASTA domain-containing protein, partial [Longimicrobium sp.]
MTTMPDFCRPRRGTRPSLDAAVASLLHLGVGAERIVAESAGPGWPAGAVARQEPAPGTPLTARTRVVLAVGGAGALDTLPFPLRDEHEGELRAGALLALADNPILKLGIFIRGAGGFLAPRAEDPAAALRWIDLFHLSSALWPRELWPAVARILPSLHRVAGRAEAVPLALGVVFGLPVAGLRTIHSVVDGAGSTRLSVG